MRYFYMLVLIGFQVFMAIMVHRTEGLEALMFACTSTILMACTFVLLGVEALSREIKRMNE